MTHLRKVRPLDQIARDEDDDIAYLEDKRRERAERQSDHAPNPGDSALSQLLRVLEEDEADMSMSTLVEINALHLPACKGAGHPEAPFGGSQTNQNGGEEAPEEGGASGWVDFYGGEAA